MSNRTLPLPPLLGEYIHQLGLREPDLMQALRAETQQNPYGKMQTPPEQALLLQFLAKLIGVKRYLEIGVFTGYTTLAVGLAMPPEGKIIACDMRPDFVAIGQKYWQQAGIADNITLMTQPAREVLTNLPDDQPFDLIYIDADKANYPYYFERGLQLIQPHGLIALDNTLSAGRVVEVRAGEPPSVDIIRQLNKKLHADQRIEMIMLPICDGLTLVRKK